jgi:hypothetical protein
LECGVGVWTKVGFVLGLCSMCSYFSFYKVFSRPFIYRLGYTWEPQLSSTITNALVFYPISSVVTNLSTIDRFPDLIDLYLNSGRLHCSDHDIIGTCSKSPERTS